MKSYVAYFAEPVQIINHSKEQVKQVFLNQDLPIIFTDMEDGSLGIVDLDKNEVVVKLNKDFVLHEKGLSIGGTPTEVQLSRKLEVFEGNFEEVSLQTGSRSYGLSYTQQDFAAYQTLNNSVYQSRTAKECDAESEVDFEMISEYVVGLVSITDTISVKFGKESAFVSTKNIPVSIIDSAAQTLNTWMSSPATMVKTSTHQKLSDAVGDILGRLGYPSITLIKTLLNPGVETYAFMSEETGVKVAEITVKTREVYPKCFIKCFVLDFKGNYNEVSERLVDSFYTNIVGYEKLVSLFRNESIPGENIMAEGTDIYRKGAVLTIHKRSHNRVPTPKEVVEIVNKLINSFVRDFGGKGAMDIKESPEVVATMSSLIEHIEHFCARHIDHETEKQLDNFEEFRKLAKRVAELKASSFGQARSDIFTKPVDGRYEGPLYDVLGPNNVKIR